MQIVIDIPQKVYRAICDKNALGCDISDIKNIIRNGTPLPKGHGRLIDADEFLKDNEAYTGWILNSSDWGGGNAYKDTLEDLVNESATIIEEDKESEDKECGK